MRQSYKRVPSSSSSPTVLRLLLFFFSYSSFRDNLNLPSLFHPPQFISSVLHLYRIAFINSLLETPSSNDYPGYSSKTYNFSIGTQFLGFTLNSVPSEDASLDDQQLSSDSKSNNLSTLFNIPHIDLGFSALSACSYTQFD